MRGASMPSAMHSTKAPRGPQDKERKCRAALKKCLARALSDDFSRLLDEEQGTDVTLCAGPSQFRAHRAVLLARGLLKGVAAGSMEVRLQDCEAPELKELIRHAYTANQRLGKASGLSPSLQRAEGVNGVHEKVPDLTDPDALVLEPASGLGADLLALYQSGEACDIGVQVGERLFSAHRAVLCARSQYFRAMLCGNWMESSRQSITLQGSRLPPADAQGQFGVRMVGQRFDCGQNSNLDASPRTAVLCLCEKGDHVTPDPESRHRMRWLPLGTNSLSFCSIPHCHCP